MVVEPSCPNGELETLAVSVMVVEPSCLNGKLETLAASVMVVEPSCDKPVSFHDSSAPWMSQQSAHYRSCEKTTKNVDCRCGTYVQYQYVSEKVKAELSLLQASQE
jgi:hypothetical protein